MKVCRYLKLVQAGFCALSVFLSGAIAPASSAAQPVTALESPAYGQYNTFVRSQNFLELVSAGTESIDVRVTVFRITGGVRAVEKFTLAPREQIDVDINAMVGLINTYGIVRVEFDDNDPDKRLIARMSVYRPDLNGETYSFAYSKDLRNPDRLTTYATANSIDAQGRGFLTPNFAQIVNLSDDARDFTHNVYDQSGTLRSSALITLAHFERRDLEAGHQFGEGVFINEFIPASATTDYVATVTRYGTDSEPDDPFPDYRFAMPVDAKAGDTSDQFLPTMNMSESCWQQTNWVEVVNVATVPITATLSFRDEAGTFIGSDEITLAAKSQFHFNASGILNVAGAELGSVRVSTTIANSLIAQSAVYYHSCNSNSLQSAFSMPSTPRIEDPLIGSFNRFLGIENQLLIVGATTGARQVDIELVSGGELIFDEVRTSKGFSVLDLRLNDEEFGTSADTYGTINVDATQTDSVLGFNIRVRKSGPDNREIDFAIPTLLRSVSTD